MEDKKLPIEAVIDMLVMDVFDGCMSRSDNEITKLFNNIDGVSDIPREDRDRSFRLFENWYKDRNVQIDDINGEIRLITNPDDSVSRLCEIGRAHV